MKKVVRMLGLCALVALAFTSCKKNETNSVTFKAGINQPTSNERTYINYRNMLAWSDNDVITVFDANKEYHNFTLDNIGDPIMGEEYNGTFAVASDLVSFMGNIETKQSYTSFYPVGDDAVNTAEETVSLVIPEEQFYNNVDEFGEGSFSPNTYPMFAYNGGDAKDNTKVIDADNFMFRSDAGVLKLGFFNAPDHQIVVTSIVVTTEIEDEPLVGTITYPINYPYNPDYEGRAVPSDLKYAVTLTCNPGVVLGNNQNNIKYFNIVLLQGALTNGFTVTINGTDNGETFSQDLVCGESELNTIDAEKVTVMFPFLPLPYQR